MSTPQQTVAEWDEAIRRRLAPVERRRRKREAAAIIRRNANKPRRWYLAGNAFTNEAEFLRAFDQLYSIKRGDK